MTGIDMRQWQHLDECLLLGFPGDDHLIKLLNHCALLGKHFIYITKMLGKNNLDFYSYLVQLKQKLQMEKQACKNASYVACLEEFILDM